MTFHGHVSEEEKQRLLARSWLTLTASSAEGWCLSVVEAGACRTPTAALRVGGLLGVIVDDQTGLLADEPEELVEGVRELLADRPRLEAYSDAALARAESFTWDTTAAGCSRCMEQPRPCTARADAAARHLPRLGVRQGRRPGRRDAGLNNAIQLIFTIAVHAPARRDRLRLAGRAHLDVPVLMVAGQSMQVAAAREAAMDRLGDPAVCGARCRPGWSDCSWPSWPWPRPPSCCASPWPP